MPVTPGHFRLTAEQRQFKQLLDQYPRFGDYWDFSDRSVDLDAVNRDIGAMSSGEQLMLQFFVSVWCGNNDMSFDLFDAAKSLDDTDRLVIVDWLTNPLFP